MYNIVTITPLCYQERTNAPLISHLPLTYDQERASDAAQMGHYSPLTMRVILSMDKSSRVGPKS